MKEYNEKQKRKDRKIKDYYKHVGKLDTLDQQREFIIGIGSKADWNKLPEGYKLNIGTYLAKYAQDFEKRHPHFRVYNAVVHLDEKVHRIYISMSFPSQTVIKMVFLNSAAFQKL